MKYVDLTILMPNYNGMPYLQYAINSIIESSYYPKVLLIIDDASTDFSIKFIEDIKKNLPFVVDLIKLEKNIGMAEALNYSLKTIKTKYVMRMDADDKINNNKIQKQFDYLENNEDIFFLGTNACYVNENNLVVGRSSFPVNHSAIMKSYQRGDHGMLHGTVMFRNKYLDCINYDVDMKIGSEYSFFVKMILSHGLKAANLSDSLYTVLFHSKSTSNNLTLKNIRIKHQKKRKYFNKKYTILEYCLEFLDYYSNKLWKKILTRENNKKISTKFYYFLIVIINPYKTIKRIIIFTNNLKKLKF